MQVGLFEGNPPRQDGDGVIRRIKEVAEVVRIIGGIVIFIQHEDRGALKQGTESWKILPVLEQKNTDLLVRKQACDSFYETELSGLLEQHGIHQIIVTGCATDFCVDTTVRAAASRNYEVVVVADAHTTRDRPHLDAETIISHHNWMWKYLILPRKEVKVLPATSVVKWLQSGSQLLEETQAAPKDMES